MSRRAFTPDGIVGILMSNNHSFYTGVKSVFPTCEHRPYRKGMYFGHSLFAQHRDELRHRPLAISKERSNRRRGDRQVRLAFQGNKRQKHGDDDGRPIIGGFGRSPLRRQRLRR